MTNPTDAALAEEITELRRRLDVVESESHIRRLMARYMWLCDTPLPEAGGLDANQRIELVLELYTDDAIWEGVGDFYRDQFGFSQGTEQLREHFEGFFITKTDTQNAAAEMLLNAHYLTTEHISVHPGGETGEANWIHMQPWLFDDGSALLRSSRLFSEFRRVDGVWKIARYRTENVFVAPLPTWFAHNHPSESVLMTGV